MTRYLDYLRAKTRDTTSAGIAPGAIERFAMFPHQRDLAAWALRRGRAAIFAATGLGKTRIQLAWAQRVAEESGDVLILAPLAVADQTVTEGASIGVQVRHWP